jgi:hypothetical protein
VLACAAVNADQIVIAALLLASAGCIERPPRDAQVATAGPRAQVDRAQLRDVLLTQLPGDLTPVGAVFGNAVELVGYRLEPPQLQPGRYARVTLYWRCRAELGESWHIFIHLDDAGGSGARINRDHDPANGRFPTDAWRPGDLIADAVVFPVDRFPLALFLGFFSQGETRLTMTSPGRGRDDGANRLLAGVLPLAK